MSKDRLSLDAITGLTEEHQKYLGSELGISDVCAFVSRGADRRYGRPGLIEGLGVTEEGFDQIFKEAIDLLRRNDWDAFLICCQEFRPIPALGLVVDDEPESEKEEA